MLLLVRVILYCSVSMKVVYEIRNCLFMELLMLNPAMSHDLDHNYWHVFLLCALIVNFFMRPLMECCADELLVTEGCVYC